MYVSIFVESKKERERGREIGHGGGTCGLMLQGKMAKHQTGHRWHRVLWGRTNGTEE